MKQRSEMELRKVLFWDTNSEQLDYEKHAAYIIERVVTFGRLNEWEQIVEYYGKEKIKEEVLGLRSLDAKALKFLSLFLDVPIDNFRCYTEG